VAGDGVRDAYAGHPGGAAGWYGEHGAAYRNPHEDAVAAMVERAVRGWPQLFDGRVLDLACGSGEVTLALVAAGLDGERIDACDPFTAAAYERRTGGRAEPWSFADVAAGALGGRNWSVAICSYALHLCEPSRLPVVAMRLADVCESLVVITPHKRPALDPSWGWALADEHRDAVWRVRLRRYSASP
jgi:SAM-dependent methyltransferase